jgi:hypothetical protein
MRVLDEAGARVDVGETQLSSDRRQMSTVLGIGVTPGRYIVHWSTLDDADGEVFAGCYTFFVGQAAADAAIAAGEALDGGADCPATAPSEVTNVPSVKVSIADVDEGEAAILQIEPTNFTVRAPDGSTRDLNFGHYHIYLDKWPLELLTGENAGHGHDESEEGMHGGGATPEPDDEEHPGGLAENPVMVAKNDYTFTNLEPGVHTVTVALTFDDHSLIEPPILASASFRVRPDEGDGGVPVWSLAAGIVAGLAVGVVGGRIISGSRD